MSPTTERQVRMTRTSHQILPDWKRVITKPYLPGEETIAGGRSRVSLVMGRILTIPEEDVPAMLEEILADFSDRHPNFEEVLEENFQPVARYIPEGTEISPQRRLLIGAYFTHEYSIESAALFNPSIVPAPDQSGLKRGERRFVLSLRGTGEGHISSIEFRTGVIDARGGITLDPPTPYAVTGRRRPATYDKHLFYHKLVELEADNDISSRVLDPLPDPFSYEQLERSIEALDQQHDISRTIAFETTKLMHWLASSNYIVTFPRETDLSERVIFPFGPNESQGMEDARFVRFTHDDGTATYYASYTAFDGFEVLPQLVETEDFHSFRIATLNGSSSQNKGMGIFPRMIDGKYVMLSRNDSENLYIMTSDNIRFWNEAEKVRVPKWPWEMIQIGNCGSPIETEAGWLVLTHGVGAMRRYCIGAMLLDLDDPRRIVADLPEPILIPDEWEREGYVPNVLYSCGAMIHNGHLILPYGFSDVGVRIATIPVDDLLGLLAEHPCER